MAKIIINDLIIDVVQKKIKNLHLSVYPPNGTVKVAAPEQMDIDSIRIYIISKLDWIKKQQARFVEQERITTRDYINRESHYYLGKRYLLNIIESDQPHRVEIKYRKLNLYVSYNSSKEKRREILECWYRKSLREIAKKLIQKWEIAMHIKVDSFHIKKMKTMWGACNIEAKRIWVNLELAQKDISCIEYIVVHEMVHLLERNHNQNFTAYMNRFLPEWKVLRDTLNKTPLNHQEWLY